MSTGPALKIDRREIAAAVAPGIVMAVLLAAVAAALWGAASLEQRAALAAAVEPYVALVFGLWALFAGGAGVWLRSAYLRWAPPAERLAESAEAALASGVDRAIEPAGSAGVRRLTGAVNALLAQRHERAAEFDARVLDASRQVQAQRNQLAALMSELTQAVLVCNIDGRILLYNARARSTLQGLSQASGVAAEGAALVGLGRSIHTVVDERLLRHALGEIRRKLEARHVDPSTQFVTTTRGGQLLRAQMAPVRATRSEGADEQSGAAEDAGAESAPLDGYVLMFENITREFEGEVRRDRMLHALTEASRASLGNLLAAAEILGDDELEPDERARFGEIVRLEATAMSGRIRDLAQHTTQLVRTRWPLEPMLGADLIDAARNRIEATSALKVNLGEIAPDLWLRVDSFSVIETLAGLAARLADELELSVVRLRLTPAPAGQERIAAPTGAAIAGRAQLDLAWTGRTVSTESVVTWETDTLSVDGKASPLTVRDVVERHQGAFWFDRDRARHETYFRIVLPQADESARDEAHGAAVRAQDLTPEDSRPEYFDFDLFATQAGAAALLEQSLSQLTYTVFDTETTGLEPSQGDEILQIGATRIVAGKLLRQECFDQLVDPQRPIPAAGIPIHGIEPAMVEGQPTIDVVLPAFHAFAQDSVLVAHNAAFDLRFLQLKEERTGCRFDMPVLDTLLLSTVLHPQQESHRLEAIAERLDVAIHGRHQALGDAIATAEVFARMIPLLQAQGIETLGQALEASRKSYLARVSY